MKNICWIAAIFTVLALSACGLNKQNLGLEHRGPNESNVKVNNPLILPPEYNVRPTNAVPYPQKDETADE